MLTVTLLMLAAISGYAEASEECETPVLQHCQIDAYNFDAPTTKDELITFCKNGKQALECVVSVLTRCKADQDGLSKLIEIQSNVDIVCNESNILYQVVYENIECIGSALTSAYFGCPNSVDKGMEIALAEKGLLSALAEQTKCSSSLFLMSCVVVHTHQLCGEVPANAALEIFEMFHLPIHCTQEIAAELPTIVQAIALVEQQGELEDAFIKR